MTAALLPALLEPADLITIGIITILLAVGLAQTMRQEKRSRTKQQAERIRQAKTHKRNETT